uniref:Uncharacterized protein n=1 Tax=Oryza meridionalis TaxID=40149 RepID=A0A0E0DN75_9ORYZ
MVVTTVAAASDWPDLSPAPTKVADPPNPGMAGAAVAAYGLRGSSMLGKGGSATCGLGSDDDVDSSRAATMMITTSLRAATMETTSYLLLAATMTGCGSDDGH